MKTNIAFDMDGIIADFSGGFRPWVKRFYGIECIERDQFYWEMIPHLSKEGIDRIVAEFIREYHSLIQPHTDGAALVRYVWHKTKKPITIITARDHSTIQASHDWFRWWFPEIRHIIITVGSGTNKIDYLHDFDVFVDDRRKTVVDLAIDGKTVIMPVRKYNMPITKTKLIHPLSERIIVVNSLKPVCDGSFDHLLFKS